jgi:hypothetical protein
MRALVLTLVTLVAAPSSIFAQGKAPAEGIKVHGHWTIDVKNPDGTLVSHREFDNALQTDGQTSLAKILTHGTNALGWVVMLADSSGNPVLILAEPALTTQNAFGQAIVQFPSNGVLNVTEATTSGKDTAVLYGSFQSPTAASIWQVQSWLFTQAPGQGAIGGGMFSQHPVSQPGTTNQPIVITANQLVQVSVVFSFS